HRQQRSMIGVPAGQRVDPANLPGIAAHAARVCGLGPVRSATIITTGYEDCNLDLATEHNQVVVKVFATWRPARDAERTTHLISSAIAAGVHHPPLLADEHGQVLHRDPASGARFLVMKRSTGSDYYRLDRPPTETELASLIGQAV